MSRKEAHEQIQPLVYQKIYGAELSLVENKSWNLRMD